MCQRPETMSRKTSSLPAVEVIAPGGSYNPDFFSHQVRVIFILFLFFIFLWARAPNGSPPHPNALSILQSHHWCRAPVRISARNNTRLSWPFQYIGITLHLSHLVEKHNSNIWMSYDDSILALPVFPLGGMWRLSGGAQGTVVWTASWDLRIFKSLHVVEHIFITLSVYPVIYWIQMLAVGKCRSNFCSDRYRSVLCTMSL